MSSVVKEIENQLERWYQTLLTGDADKVTLLYAEDAILLSTLGQEFRSGKLRSVNTSLKNFFQESQLAQP